MTTSVMGEEGFRWFFGKVEDRNDPKKIGRLRVRIYNVHPFSPTGEPDIVNVPTDHLPWATPINSVMSAGIITEKLNDGVGISPTGILVGSTVFGFFADGNECQIPIILGTLAGLFGKDEISELPQTAVEKSSVGASKNQKRIAAQSPFPGEPTNPYSAKYPYNKSMRTESGHLIEVDDTPNNERIHIYHRTGTFIEIDNSGQLVVKSTEDKFDITTKNNNVYVGGNVNVRIKGNVNVLVDGTYTLESKGNMLIKAPRIDFNP